MANAAMSASAQEISVSPPRSSAGGEATSHHAKEGISGEMFAAFRATIDIATPLVRSQIVPARRAFSHRVYEKTIGRLRWLVGFVILRELLWAQPDRALGHLTRYADDRVLVSRTRSAAEPALQAVTPIWPTRNLTGPPTKTGIVDVQRAGCEVLGCHVPKGSARKSGTRIPPPGARTTSPASHPEPPFGSRPHDAA